MRSLAGKLGRDIESSQDSAKLSVLAASNALLCRPADAVAAEAGAMVPYIAI